MTKLTQSKEQEKVVLSTRIPKKLKTKLIKLATKKGCSLSEYVGELLSTALILEKSRKQSLKQLQQIEKKLLLSLAFLKDRAI